LVSDKGSRIFSELMTDNKTTSDLTIYTDGACSPNPGPGGWGAVIIGNGSVISELSGNDENSTNNRMELTAAVKALESIEKRTRILLFTDSIYLKNGITDWIVKWQTNNWRTANKQEVKNSDLWRQLHAQTERHTIDWHWVKGHGNNPYNIRADELAVAARKNEEKEVLKHKAADLSPDRVHLFTGVTCKHATGVGAWSVILNWRDHVKVLGDRVTDMTANQLYILALTRGLESLKKQLPVNVYTHSGYLFDGATSWIEGWRKRNWLTRNGEAVSNKSMWQGLDTLLNQYQVAFHLEDKDNPHCFLQEAKELAREFELEF